MTTDRPMTVHVHDADTGDLVERTLGPDEFPAQISVCCDWCHTTVTGDYVVNETMAKPERLEVARATLRRKGWQCDESGDYCPDQATPPDSKNCWIIVDSDGSEFDDGDHSAHYGSQADAEKAIASPGHTARQLDQPCQTITCVCCDVTFDEDGEGYTVHFDDPETIPLTGWKPEGDGWRCDVCVKGPCDIERGHHG
ncbi:hypothetical protein J5X84_36295 [Streptosporangiaceae bacterium NEAU-GS5]|nr:hypothetical protein [Streptosporangiaceae bacterium NEAU-GS5]